MSVVNEDRPDFNLAHTYAEYGLAVEKLMDIHDADLLAGCVGSIPRIAGCLDAECLCLVHDLLQ